jgi:uncharacterized protein (TIGR02147 family)
MPLSDPGLFTIFFHIYANNQEITIILTYIHFMCLPKIVGISNTIYSYTDYRAYLRDYYSQRKHQQGYTYRDFARDAGMNSSAWLSHLIRGTKNLSTRSIPRVCAALGLSGAQADYFGLLVAFCQAKSSAYKDRAYTALVDHKRTHAVAALSDEHHEYYRAWYHPVVRSLVTKIDFGDNYYRLATALNPPITTTQARRSVKLLLKLGLIEPDGHGGYCQTSSLISTGDELESLNIVNYHKQVAGLAQEAYDRSSREQREISALTLGLGEKEFVLIKEKLRQVRKDIIEIVKNAETADRVYQLNLQFFPVSRLAPQDEQQ